MVAQPVQAVANKYPQGTYITSAGAVSVVLVWFSSNIVNLSIDATTAAVFAWIFTSAAAFIGRKGIKGFFTLAWRGSGDD